MLNVYIEKRIKNVNFTVSGEATQRISFDSFRLLFVEALNSLISLLAHSKKYPNKTHLFPVKKLTSSVPKGKKCF